MYKCPNKPKSIYSKKDRIICIGDLHGDYKKTIELFQKLKLIDKDLNWVAFPRNTFVVQLGDQVDGGGRGVSETKGELKLLDFMEKINVKANLNGGAVLSLIGNHEIMNLIGDFRYSSKNDIEEQGGLELRKKIFAPGGDLFNKLSCTRNTIVQVGDFVFAHAGILPKHLDGMSKKDFFDKVNTLMRLFLQGRKTVSDQDVQRFFLDKDGIIWNRAYGSEKPKCDNWSDVSKSLNIGHMVIGHTIQENINSKCDNNIWRVDVGLSETFGTDNTQVLEILDNGVPKPKNNFKPIRIID